MVEINVPEIFESGEMAPYIKAILDFGKWVKQQYIDGGIAFWYSGYLDELPPKRCEMFECYCKTKHSLFNWDKDGVLIHKGEGCPRKYVHLIEYKEKDESCYYVEAINLFKEIHYVRIWPCSDEFDIELFSDPIEVCGLQVVSVRNVGNYYTITVDSGKDKYQKIIFDKVNKCVVDNYASEGS